MTRLCVVALVALSQFACATMNPPRGNEAWREVKGTPVLWRDPGPMAARDLFWGIGSADRAPKAPFEFVSEDVSGTNPKVLVRDANGAEWTVKFASAQPHKNEVHAEVAATRLAWALGYLVEENYFVADGKLEKVGPLKRAASDVAPDGTFRTVRFEREDPALKDTEHSWSFEANPFRGSKELSGVMILAAVMNNWDLKHDNTAIVQVQRPDGLEAWYLFSDFGSTFGKMSKFPRVLSGRDRWNLEAYRRAPLVKKVERGQVYLNYSGTPIIDSVPVEHARWFSELAVQLSKEQVHRAFEASGASAAERDGFSARFLEKIQELHAAVTPRLTTRH